MGGTDFTPSAVGADLSSTSCRFRTSLLVAMEWTCGCRHLSPLKQWRSSFAAFSPSDPRFALGISRVLPDCRLQTYAAFFFRSTLFLNSAIMLNKKEELSCYNTLIFRGTLDAGFLTKRHLAVLGQQTMVFLVARNKIERSSCGRDNGHWWRQLRSYYSL